MPVNVSALPMLGGILSGAETTIVPGSANERRINFAMISNVDTANTRRATLRIKNGATVVEEFVVILDARAKDSQNKAIAYLWDMQAPRYLPANWTITAFADAASVVRWSMDLKQITVS